MSSIWFRSKKLVNTDPQRRCYNGVNFSEEWVWSEWEHVMDCSSKEVAEDIASGFQAINPTREYRVNE
jgi:hypothetical protein